MPVRRAAGHPILIACSATGLDRAPAGDADEGARALAIRLRERVGVYQVANDQWMLLRYVEPPASGQRRRV